MAGRITGEPVSRLPRKLALASAILAAGRLAAGCGSGSIKNALSSAAASRTSSFSPPTFSPPRRRRRRDPQRHYGSGHPTTRHSYDSSRRTTYNSTRRPTWCT